MWKWLVPTGLAAAVLGGLAYLRKPEPQAGDTIGVPAGKMLAAPGGPAPQLLVTIPTSARVALRVDRVDASGITGYVTGYVDPSSGEYVGLTVPAAIGGPFLIAPSAVIDIFRAGKRL